MSNTVKSFDILTISLSLLHSYFDSPTKLFLNLYPATFSDISKLFFPCNNKMKILIT